LERQFYLLSHNINKISSNYSLTKQLHSLTNDQSIIHVLRKIKVYKSS
jgi:hypothetical protein